MFLSTVVPSALLNSNCNLNTAPYNFSLPYNFVRGRNIIISITPLYSYYDSGERWQSSFLLNNGNNNRISLSIPDDVNSFTTTMTIRVMYNYTSVINAFDYNIQVTCDMVKNIITFSPLSVVRVAGSNNSIDSSGHYTIPTLLTIQTLL